MAISCKPFTLMYYNYVEGGILADYVYVDTSCEDAWGDFYTDNTVRERTNESGRTMPLDQFRDALRFLRTCETGGAFQDIRLLANGKESYKRHKAIHKRVPTGCPIIEAILEYLDHGDETDLCGALDMMSDANMFSTEEG